VPGLFIFEPRITRIYLEGYFLIYVALHKKLSIVVAGFSPRPAMRNSNIQHDRTRAKARDFYITLQ